MNVYLSIRDRMHLVWSCTIRKDLRVVSRSGQRAVGNALRLVWSQISQTID